MTAQTLAFVALALELLREPHHRATLIRLAASAHALPTRYAPTSRTGEGMGQGKEQTMPPALIIKGSPVALPHGAGSAAMPAGRHHP